MFILEKETYMGIFQIICLTGGTPGVLVYIKIFVYRSS